MKRLFPQSLFGQTLLILLMGLLISHAVGSWIYTTDREQVVRAVGGFAAAQRITNLTRLVQETPPERRARLVAALSDESFRVSLMPEPTVRTSGRYDSPVAEAIKDFLIEQLPRSGQQPRVWAAEAEGPPFGPGHFMGRGHGMHGFGGFGGLGGFRNLQVAVPLSENQWLTFTTALPESGPTFSRQFVLSMGMMAMIILAVSVWAVRRVTAPLASLSAAAERLGKDLNAPPMPETGTIETQRASRAFNDMQVQLRNLIDNRTRVLAAISHDLRTPMTLLRLRAENVEDPQERDKMLSAIAEMESMIGTTLQFARDEAGTEAPRPTDIAALVQSVVDDLADAGMPVTIEPTVSVVYECRPDALKRAVRNLVDNALKYGKAAKAAVRTTPTTIEITVDDDGPGIPEQELSRVLEPFYRVDASRNRETGGVGLGLAIARSIVRTHGGELTLANKAPAGLRARITLPRPAKAN